MFWSLLQLQDTVLGRVWRYSATPPGNQKLCVQLHCWTTPEPADHLWASPLEPHRSDVLPLHQPYGEHWALEGHRTLMVHECLMVAATLGHFHRWQRWVELEDRDKPDWIKVPTVSVGDIRHKYSPALVLLGNIQHRTYAHPKLLGRCYDNIYH